MSPVKLVYRLSIIIRLRSAIGQEPPFDRYIAGKTLEARFTIVDSRGIQSAFLQEVDTAQSIDRLQHS